MSEEDVPNWGGCKDTNGVWGGCTWLRKTRMVSEKNTSNDTNASLRQGWERGSINVMRGRMPMSKKVIRWYNDGDATNGRHTDGKEASLGFQVDASLRQGWERGSINVRWGRTPMSEEVIRWYNDGDATNKRHTDRKEASLGFREIERNLEEIKFRERKNLFN